MLIITVTTVLLHWMCCELCVAVKVPVVWNDQGYNSDVSSSADDFTVHEFEPENAKPIGLGGSTQPVPGEYFQYTAKKPQFAVDVAAIHGVQSPERHFSAYTVLPYQEITNQAIPFESSYEVFHPYKAEEPALIDIYKDPVLEKIRSDLKSSKDRLQNYEKKTGESSISKDEYLESPEDTDKKVFPHKNVQAEFEKHRPLRRPFYYQQSPRFNMGHRLNQRFRHPLKQNYIKIKPAHYRPLHNHLLKLRQHHAFKYDDEQNEYPQTSRPENLREIPDGYDIYEKGKENYNKIRNNVDESMNAAVTQNRPQHYQNLELQTDSKESRKGGLEFIPVKSYAQVRKTETTKHLPKSAALDEATSFDELKNAPRLKEAVKSTKAQTVYSEEGYEDSAYDHAGELKHASDHEGHGGYLKEKELSNGKYKAPSVIDAHEDAGGSIEGDTILHGKKWGDSDKKLQQEKEYEDYEDDDHVETIEADLYEDNPETEITDSTREKRENVKNAEDMQMIAHKFNKTEVEFKVPEINLNNTFLNDKEILQLVNQKTVSNQMSRLEDKYPYYFRNLNTVNKNSPLKYAENLRFIPKKSEGGSEFYDSRNSFECSEVDDDVDPIPEKIKNNSTNNSNEGEKNETDANTIKRKRRQADFNQNKHQPRLKGLGDKIDCFKAKYFGENPLDSPFFYEDIISDPEEITFPIIKVFKDKRKKIFSNSNTNSGLFKDAKTSPTTIVTNKTQDFFAKNEPISEYEYNDSDTSIMRSLNNIPNMYTKPVFNASISASTQAIARPNITSNNNLTYTANQNNRKIHRRDTSFIYEPYKIVRDSQVQDSKKTTTTSNISPLIKKLQTSNIIDKVVASASVNKSQPRQNLLSRTYKDIGKNDRLKIPINKTESSIFVDVSLDSRRGEPRYEMKIKNHQSKYSQVNNKTNMSINDYNAYLKEKKSPNTTNWNTEKTSQVKGTDRPFFDVSKFLPPITSHQPLASKFNRRAVRSTTPASGNNKQTSNELNDNSDEKEDSKENTSDEEYDENPIKISRKHRDAPVPEIKENYNRTDNSDENNDSNYNDNDGSYEEEAINTQVPIKKQITQPSFSYVSKFVSAIDTPSSVTSSGFTSNDKNNTRSHTEENADSSDEYGDDVVHSSPQPKNTTYETKLNDEDKEENKNDKYEEETIYNINFDNRRKPFSYVSKFRSAIETPKPTTPMNMYSTTTATIVSSKHKAKGTVGPTVFNEDYSEEYDDDEVGEITETPVVTSTIRPIFRRKNKVNTSRNLPLNNENGSKLNLVTRLRNENRKQDTNSNKHQDKDVLQPMYREKSIKSSHRTIVTDSQSYANGDDGLIKDEIDAMIGVKHNMKDYLPLYEMKLQKKNHNKQGHVEPEDNNNEEIEPDAEENKNHDVPLQEQFLSNESSKDYRDMKINKPIIVKKKIAVHKESPANDSQNTTHFKQDINEEEIIKEYPLQKPRKNLEALDLYKHQQLAEEVNKLSDVEVFKVNLGANPKHGGNYRSEKLTELVDSEVNDGEEEEQKMHGGNFKRFQDVAETSISEQDLNSKENDRIKMNDRLSNPHRKRQRGKKRQELVSEDNIKTQNDSEDITENTPIKSKHSIRRFLGNNRRNTDNSAAEVQTQSSTEIHTEHREELKAKSKRSRSNRNKAADLLSSLARAAPILTTTPVYILDPSKRMYYYVDAD